MKYFDTGNCFKITVINNYIYNFIQLYGNQPLAQWLYVDRGSNPTTAIRGGDLMVGNPRDPSHLQIRELWVRVVVSPIIAQMYPTSCQIRVQVGRDNDHTYESLFFSYQKKISHNNINFH